MFHGLLLEGLFWICALSPKVMQDNTPAGLGANVLQEEVLCVDSTWGLFCMSKDFVEGWSTCSNKYKA